MSGNLDSQAQYFLEEIFGKNHKYEVVDGDYGDNMTVEVEGAKDYEVKRLQIEIREWVNNEGYQEVASFAVISAGSFFPSIDASGQLDETDDWDEWFRTKGYDCSEEEIIEELRAKIKEWYENSDWMEAEMDEGLEGYETFVLNLKPLSLETLEPHNVPNLDQINDFLKELKEIIDSHKKK